MGKLTAEQRKKEFDETLKSCEHFQRKFTIGNYTVTRLRSLIDEYNHCYVEKNYTYIIDKNGVPYKLCETFAGNANYHSSTKEQIENNEKLLESVKEMLIYIDSSQKLPYSLKHKKLGQNLEKALNYCLEENDFSSVPMDELKKQPVVEKMVSKYESKIEDYEWHHYDFAFSPRSYKTPDEINDYKPTKTNNNTQELQQ